MNYEEPPLHSRWTNRKTGKVYSALGCTGSRGTDDVILWSGDTHRTHRVRLENLERKYERVVRS